MDLVRDWLRRSFADPQVVLLFVLLVGGFAAVIFAGKMLAPAIAAVVIAYLLDSPATWLRHRGLPNLTAVTIVFLGFLAAALFALLTILPLLTKQLAQLVQQMPSMMARFQEILLALPERYPTLIDEAQVRQIMDTVKLELVGFGQTALQYSLNSVMNLVSIVVYAILVPLMVFFFLKDKQPILRWLGHFLPTDRHLVERVWQEVDQKTGHYVRGKAYEIVIVGSVTYVSFTIIELQFAMLLGVLTGFSVLIPYIGAALVFIPVVFVAFFQSGLSTELAVAAIVYLIIQALDGNLLSPLLFSEAVSLHPNAIIIAVLVFGGLWGFWGLFFAIPLATLAAAVVKAWPRKSTGPPATDDQIERP